MGRHMVMRKVRGARRRLLAMMRDLHGRFVLRPRAERAVRAAEAAGNPPNEVFADLSDEDWRWLTTKGMETSSTLRRYLPPAPDDAMQMQFSGSMGNRSLERGFQAYQLFSELAATHASGITAESTILDFGCGWG